MRKKKMKMKNEDDVVEARDRMANREPRAFQNRHKHHRSRISEFSKTAARSSHVKFSVFSTIRYLRLADTITLPFLNSSQSPASSSHIHLYLFAFIFVFIDINIETDRQTLRGTGVACPSAPQPSSVPSGASPSGPTSSHFCCSSV